MNKAEEIRTILSETYLDSSTKDFENCFISSYLDHVNYEDAFRGADYDQYLGEEAACVFRLADGAPCHAYITALGDIIVPPEDFSGEDERARLPLQMRRVVCNLIHRLCNEDRGFDLNRYNLYIVTEHCVHYTIVAKDKDEAYDLITSAIEEVGIINDFATSDDEGYDWELEFVDEPNPWARDADFEA